MNPKSKILFGRNGTAMLSIKSFLVSNRSYYPYVLFKGSLSRL